MNDDQTVATVDDDKRPTISEAVVQAAQACGAIPKADFNVDQGFAFRGIERILAAAGPALQQSGVLVLPRVRKRESEIMLRGANRNEWRLVTLTVEYVLVGPRGDQLSCVVESEGLDNSDKATSKAMTMAYKTMLLQVLNIADAASDPDADIAPPPRAGRQSTAKRAPAKKAAPRKAAPAKAPPAPKPLTPAEQVAPLVESHGAEHAARVQAIIERLQSIEDQHERGTAKQAFAAEHGMPLALSEVTLPLAETWVHRYFEGDDPPPDAEPVIDPLACSVSDCGEAPLTHHTDEPNYCKDHTPF